MKQSPTLLLSFLQSFVLISLSQNVLTLNQLHYKTVHLLNTFKLNLASLKKQYSDCFLRNQSGSRVGVVVRALAFHQCVPGSIPGPGVICGLSLLLVLYLLLIL